MKMIFQRRQRFGWVLALLILAADPWTSPGAEVSALRREVPAPATVLGVKGKDFTLNGRPTFLFGLSYYGALGASETILQKDLADMNHYGFNWIRVWST